MQGHATRTDIFPRRNPQRRTMEITKCIIPCASDKTPKTAGHAGGQRAATVDVDGDEGTEDLDSEA